MRLFVWELTFAVRPIDNAALGAAVRYAQVSVTAPDIDSAVDRATEHMVRAACAPWFNRSESSDVWTEVCTIRRRQELEKVIQIMEPS